MIIITCEQLGCAYSIDSEGTFFYSPLMVGGGLETEEWTEVDHLALLGEEKHIRDTINEVHQQLIAANQALGWYYTDVPMAVS